MLFYIAFWFYIALIIVKFSIALLFFRIYQNSKQNKLVLGAALLFLSYGIARIIMVVFDFSLTKFDSSVYQTYAILWKIGFLINCIGFLCLIFISERAILKKRSKYAITLFYFIFIIISIIPPDIQLVQLISIIPSALAMIFVPLTYLYLARYDTIRKRALAIFAGYVFFFMGATFLTEDLVQIFISINPNQSLSIRSLIHIVSVILKITGIMFMVFGYRKKLV